MRIWALDLDYMTFPFLYLAHCRPIHLLSIEFQSIDSNLGNPPKNFFFPFNYYNLAIHAITMIETFSTQYWDSKVQDHIVKSRKKSFHF
jgi:hypothetical protein